MDDFLIEELAKEYEQTEDCKLLREFAKEKTYLEQIEFAKIFKLETFEQFLTRRKKNDKRYF